MKNRMLHYVISVIILVVIFYIFINVFNIRPIVAYVFGGVLYSLGIYYVQKRNISS